MTRRYAVKIEQGGTYREITIWAKDIGEASMLAHDAVRNGGNIILIKEY